MHKRFEPLQIIQHKVGGHHHRVAVLASLHQLGHLGPEPSLKPLRLDSIVDRVLFHRQQDAADFDKVLLVCDGDEH